MKCLIPVLALFIFFIQIHAIFINSNANNTDSPDLKINKTQVAYSSYSNFNKFKEMINRISTRKRLYLDTNKTSLLNKEDDCSEALMICLFKCGLAFIAGMLFSDMKFIKFGVI